MDNQNFQPSDAKWPVKKSKSKISQILLGVFALLFLVGVATAAYFVSNQLSSRQAVAPTAPESEPFASTGCCKNPSQCNSKEYCNASCVCKTKAPTPTGYGENYKCTAEVCPGPCFSCNSTKTSCIAHPEIAGCGGVSTTGKTTVTPSATITTTISTAPTPSSGIPATCTPGQTTQQSCIGPAGVAGSRTLVCCPNNTYTGCAQGGSCHPLPVPTPTTCSPGSSFLIACTTSAGLLGQRRINCCSNNTYNCAQEACYPYAIPTAYVTQASGCTSQFPVCKTTITAKDSCSSTICRDGVYEGKCCSGAPAISSTVAPSAPSQPACASGRDCKVYPVIGSTECSISSTSTQWCCESGFVVNVSNNRCERPVVAGGGTVSPTSGGGGGGGGGGTSPTRQVTATPTPTIGIAGACMEVQLYSRKTDGTFNTTPMTTQQKASIKIGDTIRVAVKASKADLDARFRISYNNVAMNLPGPAVYPDAPNQRPRNGYIDPNTRLISYYDFTATRAGQYKFEGFVSTTTAPITCGGIAGKVCPSGFTCNTPRNVPDASGICVQTVAR